MGFFQWVEVFLWTLRPTLRGCVNGKFQYTILDTLYPTYCTSTDMLSLLVFISNSAEQNEFKT